MLICRRPLEPFERTVQSVEKATERGLLHLIVAPIATRAVLCLAIGSGQQRHKRGTTGLPPAVCEHRVHFC